MTERAIDMVESLYKSIKEYEGAKRKPIAFVSDVVTEKLTDEETSFIESYGFKLQILVSGEDLIRNGFATAETGRYRYKIDIP